MTRAQEQTATLSGWVVTNQYGDGIIRIAPDDTITAPFCFVRQDGSCSRVLTWESCKEEMRLRDVGIVCG